MGGLAAAIIALLMLSYAAVQSDVMQVTMADVVGQPAPGAPADRTMAAMEAMTAGVGRASSPAPPVS